MKRIIDHIKGLSPDATLIMWLAVWFVINIIQGTFSGLVNDEAYYHIYAKDLSWGYFDHPPMLALLIWLGEMICGVTEIGVRLFVIALQPLYLWIFWKTIKPHGATTHDVMLYLTICASIILMQPYGFIAVPDAPLMFSVALFLWAYKAFLEDKRLSWLWLAVSMAAMAYSKYQGALVVIFAVMFNSKLLLNPKFYLSGIVALVLFAPHLIWQYDNEFPSFVYHLSERNTSFKWSSVTEFVLNLIAVFNIFFIPIWIQAYRKVRSQSIFERALKWIPIAIFVFFLLSSVRGRTQPQWMIASTYGLVWVLFLYARDHTRTRRYVMRFGLIVIALVAILRVEILFNILGMSAKQKMSGNREHYGALYDLVGDRPVIFSGSYAIASKYDFYTDGVGYCTPALWYRTHQWQFIDESHFAGKEAIIEYKPTPEEREADAERYKTLVYPNGGEFHYYILDSYTPMKGVVITPMEPLPSTLSSGEEITFRLRITNPYTFDLKSDEDVVRLLIIFRAPSHHFQTFNIGNDILMPSLREVERDFTFKIPEEVKSGEYQVGFSLISKQMNGWFSAP
ncbi:MAG: glycosyltransferase family 39 protein, partial [Rikenellaceae bacterium]